MIRYLTVAEVLELHRAIIEQSGGAHGIRDLGAIESAVAQPRQTFGGVELHRTLLEKAAALGYSLTANHAFVDGNKRIGHAALEVFLVLNGHEISASVDEQERFVLSIADGHETRESVHEWLRRYVVPRP